jgi:hypothetical protein
VLSDQGSGSDVWHAKEHTAEPGSFEAEILTDIESSGRDQILGKLIEGVSKILRQRFENLLILFGIRRN